MHQVFRTFASFVILALSAINGQAQDAQAAQARSLVEQITSCVDDRLRELRKQTTDYTSEIQAVECKAPSGGGPGRHDVVRGNEGLPSLLRVSLLDTEEPWEFYRTSDKQGWIKYEAPIGWIVITARFQKTHEIDRPWYSGRVGISADGSVAQMTAYCREGKDEALFGRIVGTIRREPTRNDLRLAMCQCLNEKTDEDPRKCE